MTTKENKMANFEDEKQDNRPVSRRGMKGLQSNSPPRTAVGRPGTSTRIMRPPSAHAFPPRGPSRLSSGMVPPKTGSIGLSNINVLDRPITQQGVTGLRTATARGPQNRQVLDKRYFEGVIRLKMRDISNEITKLQGESETQRQLEATSSVYEARVREVAAELTDLQAQLADLNLVVDKVNTGAEASHIISEAAELKRDNDRHNTEVEQLYAENRAREDQVRKLETETQNERNLTEKLIEDMNEEERTKYEQLKDLSMSLQKEIETSQQVLDELNNRKITTEEKLLGSQNKQEAVRLYHKLREREERKAALIEEGKSRATPAQEREQLLHKVKEDNAEMAAMERQITSLNEQIKKKKDELELTEQDLEESQSDRHLKFKELKKREETMEQFLATFTENRETEVKRIEALEKKIVIALQQMSKNLEGTLTTQDELSILKETLKPETLDKTQMTVEELTKKQQQLLENMKKVENIEEKMKKEMSTLKEKIQTMHEDGKTLVNLDKLRDDAQEKRDSLMKTREDLLSKKPGVTEQHQQLQEKNEELKKKLNDNEAYIQLKNLEKKLEVLETGNTNIREFVDSKKQETDYSEVKQGALILQNKYNEMLKISYGKKN